MAACGLTITLIPSAIAAGIGLPARANRKAMNAGRR